MQTEIRRWDLSEHGIVPDVVQLKAEAGKVRLGGEDSLLNSVIDASGALCIGEPCAFEIRIWFLFMVVFSLLMSIAATMAIRQAKP